MEEILAPFQTSHDPLGLIFLIDNLPAMKVVAAWPYMKIRWQPRKGSKPPETEKARWDWLWTCVQTDLKQLSLVAGCPEERTEQVFKMLCTTRIIFPDGTVHPQARSIVAQYIQTKVKK